MEEIEKTYKEESVLICSHSSVNLMILCEILGLEINHFRHLRHSAGGLSIKDKIRGFYFLVCINDTCHLMGIDLSS